jgi:hypothetical protein
MSETMYLVIGRSLPVLGAPVKLVAATHLILLRIAAALRRTPVSARSVFKAAAVRPRFDQPG